MAIAAASSYCLAADNILFDEGVNPDPESIVWAWHRTGDSDRSEPGTVNTLADRRERSGWWLDLSRQKVPSAGADFTVVVDLRSESHNSPNRAGLTVAFTDATGHSAVVNLWEDEAWLSADAPLFGHGEGLHLGKTGQHTIKIEESQGVVAISVDGARIARVRMRDFSATKSDVEGYLQPSTLFVGDASTAAGSEFTLQSVTWASRAVDPAVIRNVVVGFVAIVFVAGLAVLWRKRSSIKRGSGRVYIQRR